MTEGDGTQLMLHSVIDRGVPNKEHIALLVLEDVETTHEYLILIGVTATPGDAIPIVDSSYWLGHGELKKGDWVFIFTGPGEARLDKLPDEKSLYSLYWGRTQTVFYDPRIVPVLIRFSEVSVLPPPPSPQPLPQFGAARIGAQSRAVEDATIKDKT